MVIQKWTREVFHSTTQIVRLGVIYQQRNLTWSHAFHVQVRGEPSAAELSSFDDCLCELHLVVRALEDQLFHCVPRDEPYDLQAIRYQGTQVSMCVCALDWSHTQTKNNAPVDAPIGRYDKRRVSMGLFYL